MLEESIRANGGTLSSYIRNILGTYTPTDPTSMAGADWEYIISAVLFLMCFWVVFKVILRLFK